MEEDIHYEKLPYKKQKTEQQYNDEDQIEDQYDDEYEANQHVDDIDEDIMKALEEAENLEVLVDSQTLNKILVAFEKHMAKNQELRAKFAHNPEKFMDSEVDLDEDIKKIQSIAAYPELLGDFVENYQNCILSLIQLISHENLDISIDVINLFNDIVSIEYNEEQFENIQNLYKILLDKNNTFLEALVQNIFRLQEEKQEESEAILNTLSILENMIEVMPVVIRLVCERTKIIHWIFKKLLANKCKSINMNDENNRLYASEILSILISNSYDNQYTLGKIGGIQHLLQLIKEFRKSSIDSVEQQEMLENVFDVLSSCLLVEENKIAFKKLQGQQLMIRVLREKNSLSKLSIKILSIVLDDSQDDCHAFVEGLGLKYLFPVLVQKGIKEKEQEDQKQIDEYVLSCIKSLLQYSEKVFFDRVINKFRENNYEKLDRLIELFQENKKQVNQVSKIFQDQQNVQALIESDGLNVNDKDFQNQLEEKIYIKKLDQGLSILELISIILLILYNSDQKINDIQYKVKQLIKLHAVPINELKDLLKQKLQFMGQTEKAERYKQYILEIIEKTQ